MSKFGFGCWEAGQTIPAEVGFFFVFGSEDRLKGPLLQLVRTLHRAFPAPLAKAPAARRDDLPVLRVVAAHWLDSCPGLYAIQQNLVEGPPLSRNAELSLSKRMPKTCAY